MQKLQTTDHKLLDKEIAYNLKTSAQILIQFYMVMNINWFCKSNKSRRIGP